MEGKPEAEGESMEWELLHHNDGDDGGATATNELGPPLESCALIRPDYFSIHPPTALQSSSPSSPASSNNLPLSHESDSDYEEAAVVLPQAEASSGGAALDSKEEEEEEKNKEMEEAVKEEERSGVWWKVPFEVFKYWVVRVSPVPAWSLSVAAAAAFVGLVILGRRLYKMKRKTQTLKLNVALDDKKVSQLMGRVARLNEAFSVVRRVPIVRPSLPAPPSVTLRPVMSIR